jgi:pyruvate/2-oxoglutarate dehydrogenase complex dihydrolipoamide acyltransferase (E2) component
MIWHMECPGQGSGLYGSLKSGDVADRGAPSGVPAPVVAPAPGASFVDVPLSGMRDTIARRLSAAKQTIPHYQLCATVNVEKTLAMRKAVNDRLTAEKADVKVGRPWCPIIFPCGSFHHYH